MKTLILLIDSFCHVFVLEQVWKAHVLPGFPAVFYLWNILYKTQKQDINL